MVDFVVRCILGIGIQYIAQAIESIFLVKRIPKLCISYRMSDQDAPASSILAMSSGVRTAVKRPIRSEKDCESFQNKRSGRTQIPCSDIPL